MQSRVSVATLGLWGLHTAQTEALKGNASSACCHVDKAARCALLGLLHHLRTGPDPDECDGAHGDAKDSEDHVAADFADEVPAEFDDNSPAEVDEAVPADFGGDRVADNEEPGGGDWQEMDNEAGACRP